MAKTFLIQLQSNKVGKLDRAGQQGHYTSLASELGATFLSGSLLGEAFFRFPSKDAALATLPMLKKTYKVKNGSFPYKAL